MQPTITDRPPIRRAYSLRDAAEVLRVSQHTVERLCKSGAIRSVLISPRRRIIPSDELERLLGGKSAPSRQPRTKQLQTELAECLE